MKGAWPQAALTLPAETARVLRRRPGGSSPGKKIYKRGEL